MRRSKRRASDALWHSPFGRLAFELNRAELDLLEHAKDPAYVQRRDNLAAAIKRHAAGQAAA